VGLGAGSGRVRAHRVDVAVTRRAASPRETRASLWFPSPSGEIPSQPRVAVGKRLDSAGAR
jgi:hypothetical protein